MDMIGNLLASERKKKGLEIIDVEHTTGIRAAYLAALEEGRYSALPGDVYVKGFIRNYGNYLGLDGAHLVQLYNDAMQSEAAAAPPSVAAKIESSRKKSSQRQMISSIIIVLLLILSAWGLYAWQKSSPTEPSMSKTGPTAVKPANSASTQPAVVGPSGGPSTTVPALARPITLIARYSDRCWTSVIADGKSIYEGVPKLDEVLTWQADRQIVVNFGNAGAVELTFNGQSVGKIGERGEVVVKTFTAQAVRP